MSCKIFSPKVNDSLLVIEKISDLSYLLEKMIKVGNLNALESIKNQVTPFISTSEFKADINGISDIKEENFFIISILLFETENIGYACLTTHEHQFNKSFYKIVKLNSQEIEKYI